MVVAIVVNLAAYTCSATISGVDSARELAAVLPLGAVLAARLTAQRLIAGKLIPVVLAAVLGCAGILAYNAGRPAISIWRPQLMHLVFIVAGFY